MRDNFSNKVKEDLAKRVGYRCSNPNCKKLTTGPKEDKKGNINIGEAAHISAASEGGMRYNSEMMSEQRKDIENGIWLCRNCAALIDRDISYSVNLLAEWKNNAEMLASREIKSNCSENSVVGLDAFDIGILDLIIQIMEDGNTEYILIENDFHNDFQREYLNPIFNLAETLKKPSKSVHNKEFSKYIKSFLGEINKFRNLIAFRGGPSRFGNGSFIIDREEDQKKCNDICDNIWNEYKEIIRFKNNL